MFEWGGQRDIEVAKVWKENNIVTRTRDFILFDPLKHNPLPLFYLPARALSHTLKIKLNVSWFGINV